MNTMNIGIITFRPHQASRWHQLKGCVGEWRRQVRSRNELTSLNDWVRQDIGMSGRTANFEACKPF